MSAAEHNSGRRGHPRRRWLGVSAVMVALAGGMLLLVPRVQPYLVARYYTSWRLSSASRFVDQVKRSLGLNRPAPIREVVGVLAPVSLPGAQLPLAPLQGVNLAGADLSRANLRRANLDSANLRSADLAGADLSQARLRGANLGLADLAAANLQGADLRGAYLVFAGLENTDLRGADLRGANLKCSLAQARLDETTRMEPKDRLAYQLATEEGVNRDLRGVDLSRTFLVGTDLRQADLTEANLQGAWMFYADLRGADLRGANLRGTGLTGANLAGADLRGAKYNAHTVLPHPAFDPVQRGAVLVK